VSSLEYEVSHASGKYTGQDGTEKTRWKQCGVVFKSDKGNLSMKLEYVPTSRNEEGDLWLNLFVPKPREQQPAQQGFRGTPKQDSFEDADIPAF
jgi:hypothetical protein